MLAENRHGHKLLEFIPVKSEKELSDMKVVGGHAVLLYENRLILCWNKYRDNWELPGGGCEPGESLRECVRRELSEETNQNVTALTIKGISRVFIPRMNREVFWAVYTGEVTTLQPFIKNEEMEKMILRDFAHGLGTMDEIDMRIVEFVVNADMIAHYDALVDENNDPARDPPPLQKYMSKWDGDCFIEELRLNKEKKVLEIGVGTGRLAKRICGYCDRFTGIDFSPKTVERAKENLAEFDNINLICGDFLEYRFTEQFDVIYTSLTFMHIKDKQKAINKAAWLLKHDGRFVLSIDNTVRSQIDYGSRKLLIYPDCADKILQYIEEAGLFVEKQFRTEFAIIFTAVKNPSDDL